MLLGAVFKTLSGHYAEDAFSGKTNPRRRNVLNASLKYCAAVNMCPKRREDREFALFGLDRDFLQGEFSFSARAGHVVEVPDRDQLALGELSGPTVYVPMVVLPGQSALHVVADVLERISAEEGKHLREIVEG